MDNCSSSINWDEDLDKSWEISVPAIHIRIFKRNAHQSVTTIENLPAKFNLKSITKSLKKSLNCNGNIVDDPTSGKVISLQGDHRQIVKTFLISNQIVKESDIVIHGF
jgi:translation initiation factor SUI1